MNDTEIVKALEKLGDGLVADLAAVNRTIEFVKGPKLNVPRGSLVMPARTVTVVEKPSPTPAPSNGSPGSAVPTPAPKPNPIPGKPLPACPDSPSPAPAQAAPAPVREGLRIARKVTASKSARILAVLEKAGRPMVVSEIVAELHPEDRKGADPHAAVAALLNYAAKHGHVERCGKQLNPGAAASTIWKLAGQPEAPPAPAIATVAAVRDSARQSPAPKPAAPSSAPSHELTDAERERFPKAPRKGQVWQGAGLTRIVQGVTFDPARPDTYRVSFTQPPGALPQLMYRATWESWTEQAKCIKEKK